MNEAKITELIDRIDRLLRIDEARADNEARMREHRLTDIHDDIRGDLRRDWEASGYTLSFQCWVTMYHPGYEKYATDDPLKHSWPQ